MQEQGPTQPPAEHWTDQIGGATTCPNCDHPTSGVFCPNCGQKQLPSRLRFRPMVANLVSQLVGWDRGLLVTTWAMVRHPGLPARHWCQGKQRTYVNPLGYFFLGTAIQLLLLWVTRPYLRADLIRSFTKSANLDSTKAGMEKLEGLLKTEVIPAMADNYLATISQAYTYASLIFMCLPFAWLLYHSHRLIGERFSLGETLVFALYTVGHTLIACALIAGIATPLTGRIQVPLTLACYAIVPLISHGQFFRRTWLSRLMTLTSMALAFGVFIMAVMVIFMASLAAQVLWALSN